MGSGGEEDLPASLIPVVASVYHLAADAEDERAPTRSVRELTFSTDDGSLIVRIFPNESGVGATAVLVGTPEPPAQKPGEAIVGSGGSVRQPHVFLRVDQDEYSFDPEGAASLPGFPAAAVSIVVR